MERQISAVRDLVTVTNQQLGANLIDMDADHGDVLIKYHKFEAFFSVPNIDGVVHISSDGLPSAQVAHGLFLDIYCKSKKKKKTVKLVEIHTAKVPELIDEREALKLSDNKPEQLLQIAEIVKSAIPIEPNKFYSFFKGPIPFKDRPKNTSHLFYN